MTLRKWEEEKAQIAAALGDKHILWHQVRIYNTWYIIPAHCVWLYKTHGACSRGEKKKKQKGRYD